MSFSSDSSAGAVYIELPPWHTSDWDTGLFDDEAVPGFVHIEIERGPKYDRKPVKGQTGETQTFGGWNNADMKIRIRTWTDAQYRDFLARILPILEPDPTKDAPKEIKVDHTQAVARKVESFRVAKLKGPIANFKDGYTEWEVDAFQTIKKAPAPQGPPGKPGETPCQRALAQYNFHATQAETLVQRLATLNVRIIAGDGSVGDLAERDALSVQLERARAEQQKAATMMDAMGCGNISPSAGAAGGAAGGVPPP